MSNEWTRIKNSAEYREARKEIEDLIKQTVVPLSAKISACESEIGTLHSEITKLKDQIAKA